MTFEDDLVLIGQLNKAVAMESPQAGRAMAEVFSDLLGNQTSPERAARLRELADLLTDFGTYLRNRADVLS
jgi:uncharacterized protein YaaR (DUF327 family)